MSTTKIFPRKMTPAIICNLYEESASKNEIKRKIDRPRDRERERGGERGRERGERDVKETSLELKWVLGGKEWGW